MADGPGEFDDPAAAASYVATMVAELSTITRQHHFDALSYILDMARLEAENTHRQLNGRGGKRYGTPSTEAD
jgi:hypothetical protein